MKKNKNSNRLPFYKRAFGTVRASALSTVVLLVLAFGAWVGYTYAQTFYQRYEWAVNFTETESIRSLTLKAIENIGQPAPVEARSGDIYFPDVKLYLPRPTQAVEMRYTLDLGDDQALIGIVDKRQLDYRFAKLQQAPTVDKFFKEVAGMQACSRGVILNETNKAPVSHDQPELKQTIKLADGRTLYAWIDADCQVNAQTAELLKNLRSY